MQGRVSLRRTGRGLAAGLVLAGVVLVVVLPARGEESNDAAPPSARDEPAAGDGESTDTGAGEQPETEKPAPVLSWTGDLSQEFGDPLRVSVDLHGCESGNGKFRIERKSARRLRCDRWDDTMLQITVFADDAIQRCDLEKRPASGSFGGVCRAVDGDEILGNLVLFPMAH